MVWIALQYQELQPMLIKYLSLAQASGRKNQAICCLSLGNPPFLGSLSGKELRLRWSSAHYTGKDTMTELGGLPVPRRTRIDKNGESGKRPSWADY